MARLQHVFVQDVSTGKKTTLKQFKNHSTDLLMESCITKKEIIQSKFIKGYDLENLITKYKISVTKRGKDYYINKDQLAKALKSEKLTKK
jgi:hypothetical protein